MTFPRFSRRGRHFAKVRDVIIYPHLVVARTDDGFLRRKEVRSVYLVTYGEANMETYPVTWKMLLRS